MHLASYYETHTAAMLKMCMQLGLQHGSRTTAVGLMQLGKYNVKISTATMLKIGMLLGLQYG